MQFAPGDLKWNNDALIPAIIQDAESGQVLSLVYMNKEAIARTIASGKTWTYSRSRGRLAQKGEQSGHVQYVQSIETDCDQDALLLKVHQVGPGACHEGYRSCFHFSVGETAHSGNEQRAEVAKPDFDPASVYGGGSGEEILKELYQVIKERKSNPTEGSYTSYLFREGVNKILKKVGEEAAEVIIAAKDPQQEPFVYEVGDLFYHVLVLLAEREVAPQEVWAELRSRRPKKTE